MRCNGRCRWRLRAEIASSGGGPTGACHDTTRFGTPHGSLLNRHVTARHDMCRRLALERAGRPVVAGGASLDPVLRCVRLRRRRRGHKLGDSGVGWACACARCSSSCSCSCSQSESERARARMDECSDYHHYIVITMVSGTGQTRAAGRLAPCSLVRRDGHA